MVGGAPRHSSARLPGAGRRWPPSLPRGSAAAPRSQRLLSATLPRGGASEAGICSALQLSGSRLTRRRRRLLVAQPGLALPSPQVFGQGWPDPRIPGKCGDSAWVGRPALWACLSAASRCHLADPAAPRPPLQHSPPPPLPRPAAGSARHKRPPPLQSSGVWLGPATRGLESLCLGGLSSAGAGEKTLSWLHLARPRGSGGSAFPGRGPRLRWGPES